MLCAAAKIPGEMRRLQASGFRRRPCGTPSRFVRRLAARMVTMNDRPPRRPLGGLLFLLLVAFAGWALWSGALRVPDAWNPWAPLRIDDPPNFLPRFKFDRVSGDRDTCRATLAQAQLAASPHAARPTA